MDFNLIPQYSDIKAITEIGGVLESLILLYKASYLFDIKELIWHEWFTIEETVCRSTYTQFCKCDYKYAIFYFCVHTHTFTFEYIKVLLMRPHNFMQL